MTADPALPITLNVNPATATTTETIGGNGKHESVTTSARSNGTATHSTLKHDDSHIHRASPIRGLPPEDKTIKNTTARQPHGNIKIPASNKLRLAKPTTPRVKHPQDRGQEPAKQLESKYDDGHNHSNPPICRLLMEIKSPRDKAGTRNGESSIHNQLWQPATTGHQQCYQNIDNIQSDQTTTFAQPPEWLEPPKLPEARPEELMDAIDKWFDYQASLQVPTTPNNDRNTPLTKPGSECRKQEQPSEWQLAKNGLQRQTIELDTKEATDTDKRVIHNQSAWKKGFLATQPSTHHSETSSEFLSSRIE